ncbi:hypothetical protein SDC9_211991 [bioreactor metagenome]|uniref:Uncharacterized protein n=1 Tax=bioreactor metagenome TaxID=1076179 RepID=A0A645JMA2_9ZZZZ
MAQHARGLRLRGLLLHGLQGLGCLRRFRILLGGVLVGQSRLNLLLGYAARHHEYKGYQQRQQQKGRPPAPNMPLGDVAGYRPRPYEACRKVIL